jgi:diguanylate cyclase (GGDEF)-like protein
MSSPMPRSRASGPEFAEKSASMVRRLPIHLSLRVRLGLLLPVGAIALAFGMTFFVSRAGGQWLRASVGNSMALVANQMSTDFDHVLAERFRDIALLANLFRDPTIPPADVRNVLARLLALEPDYAWIGVATTDGTVIAGTDGVFEGQRVADRGWFTRGLREGNVGNIYEDPGLAQLTRPTGEVPRFIDLSIPLKDESGQTWGVLGATLSLAWQRNAEASTLRLLGEEHRGEVIVTNPAGEVVIAPVGSPLLGTALQLESLKEARVGGIGFTIERWPDQNPYLVGFAPSVGGQGFTAPGWIVLVRQNQDIADAPVRELQQRIGIFGVLAGLLFAYMGWVLAGRIASPLAEIAEAARLIEGGTRDTPIPHADGRDELAVLAQALGSLVSSLITRERELEALAQSLEQRVAERTAELSIANEHLSQISGTDAVTGLSNRRMFNEVLEREWQRALRYELPFSLILADIDHFKLYNDTYGHQKGDECLRRVAAGVAQTIARGSDLAARYGGEEFGVVLTHTDELGAWQTAQRLLRTIRTYRIPHESSLVAKHVTISLGIASVVPQPGTTPDELVRLADAALYRAKEQGRDRAVVSEGQPEHSQVPR